MPSTFRIPKATMSGPYAGLLKAYARRTWGDVPDTAYVVWHHKKVMNAVLGFERKVARWDALDPHLASLRPDRQRRGHRLQLVHGLRLLPGPRRGPRRGQGARGAALARVRRVHPARARRLEYAEAMSATPCAVDDELSHRLQEALGVKAVVELTQLVALENMRSRFNSAAGLQSQGFSDVCELPLAVPSHA